MSAVHDMRNPSDYDGLVTELEDEVLHLNALKVAQEPDSDAAYSYQQRINLLTGRAMALHAARRELHELDARIEASRREARRAADKVDEAMDFAWAVVKLAGGAGLFGLLICFMWVPTVWLPITTAVLLAVAVGAIVLALRVRPGLNDAADEAAAATLRLETVRQGVLAQAEAGVYTPPSYRPAVTAAAERVAPDTVPEPRAPLRLVAHDDRDTGRDSARDDGYFEDAEIVGDDENWER